jgi:hypothetical protein
MWLLAGSQAGEADAADGRGHSHHSYDVQEEGESPIDPQEQCVVSLPDHVADFGNGNDGDFVDGDPQNVTQSIALRGIDFEPELIRIIAKHHRQTLHLWPPSATARAIEPAAALSRSGHEILVNLTRLQEEPLSEAL